MSARAAVAALAALAFGLCACGVPEDESPRALAPHEVPFASPPSSPVADQVGDVPLVLSFVREGQVEPVSRSVERSVTTAELVELLFGGPTPEESAAGLISVIPSTLEVEDVTTTGGTAVVTLSGPDSEVLRTPPLAFAQIVATLVPERADGVRFRLGGRDLPVPLADSSLTAVPLTRADYAQLLASRPAGPSEPAPPAPAADETAPPAPAASPPA